MNIDEMRSEISEAIKDEVIRIGAERVSVGDLERTIQEFADGHRAVIYADLELFGYFDVQQFEDEAVEMLHGDAISVASIASLTIYLFILHEGAVRIHEVMGDLPECCGD